jgi:hypothetical protein
MTIAATVSQTYASVGTVTTGRYPRGITKIVVQIIGELDNPVPCTDSHRPDPRRWPGRGDNRGPDRRGVDQAPRSPLICVFAAELIRRTTESCIQDPFLGWGLDGATERCCHRANTVDDSGGS